MKVIVNGKIFIGNKFYDNKIVLIKDEKILDIMDKEKFSKYKKISSEKIEEIDAKNNYVVPGFIDLQINGCGGVLFNDNISLKTLQVMNETNLKTGCTSFTPTLITTSDENIKKAISLMEEIKNKHEYGVLGLHIEGPYISLEKKGIHNPEFIRTADENIIDLIIKSGKENIKIITLAPEKTGKDLILKLEKSGICVSLGHSNATYEEVKEKENFGVSLATHLYNGMSSFSHREPGSVGAIFDSDIKAGIIVDGFHVHYAAVKVAIKLMKDRLFLVTDAVSPTGTNMEYFYFEGKKVFHKDGKCYGEDGTLGGSALTMDKGIKNLIYYCGVTLEEAIRMATLYPARAIKIDNKYGKLQSGYFADVVILDENIDIKKVISKGKVY